MAEVLAPITQPNTAIAMLHSPSSANPQSLHQASSSSSPPRSNVARTQYYNTAGGGIGYRVPSATPVQPYAFQQTPQLRAESRSTSAPVNPYSQAPGFVPTVAFTMQSHATNHSSSSGSTVSSPSSNLPSTPQRSDSKDDSAMSRPPTKQASSDTSMSTKRSPDRYRRPRNSNAPGSPSSPQEPKSATPSGSGMAGVAHLYKGTGLNSRPGHNRTSSMDDSGSSPIPDQAKRYRRRSLNTFDARNDPSWTLWQPSDVDSGTHKNIRTETLSSMAHPAKSSLPMREATQSTPSPTSPISGLRPRSPLVPARGSSADATNRIANPSPLSRSAPGPASPPGKSTVPHANAGPASPAAQRLAALTDKDKSTKSRLRRALSFGSAAELRKASAQNASSARMARGAQLHEETDPEDAAMAAKQEAAGLGNNIYSGQGGVFSGSTDNLSISSTASSASIMLRKMGHGMKKGGRSLKGLFRPKSVIGVPAADSAVQASVGEVSMVNVEAERGGEIVSPNQIGHMASVTGFPKSDSDSRETSSVSNQPLSSSASAADPSRKSIIGTDAGRAEVLAAVRKGILKRTGTDSPSPQVRPADGAPGFTHHHDTPNSSVPSTPGDDGRPSNVQLSSEDYFAGITRLAAGSSRSLPATPHGGPRNISFSPRIQFHDAWSSSEYDRRGDVATCNRLTPMLAQQIKEELNSFKMEMEVHEQSKPHTHFF